MAPLPEAKGLAELEELRRQHEKKLAISKQEALEALNSFKELAVSALNLRSGAFLYIFYANHNQYIYIYVSNRYNLCTYVIYGYLGDLLKDCRA